MSFENNSELTHEENEAYDEFKKNLKSAIHTALATQLTELSGFDTDYCKTSLDLIGSWKATEYKDGVKMLSETDVSFVKSILGSTGHIGKVALSIVIEYQNSL